MEVLGAQKGSGVRVGLMACPCIYWLLSLSLALSISPSSSRSSEAWTLTCRATQSLEIEPACCLPLGRSVLSSLRCPSGLHSGYTQPYQTCQRVGATLRGTE